VANDKRAGSPTARLAGETLPAPSADFEARLGHCERTLGEIFDLMQLLCDELGVDTNPADETAPMLRVIKGGRAG
jgi:hypothetical protein